MFSNTTLFGIKNDAERLVWASWLMLIFLVSVLGNTTVLVASIRYKAFKLHQVVVTFIQHIAVCDLLISVAMVLTQSINLFANKRIFSSDLCYARAYLSPYSNSVSLFLICGMTVSKLLLIKFPLKSRRWSRKDAHMLCACLWGLSLYSPIMAFSVDKDDVYWDGRMYTCYFAFRSDTWKWLLPASVGLLWLAPTIVTITASVFLVNHLLFARKVAKRTGSIVPWQGIVTVVLSVTVYCVSFFTISIMLAIKPKMEETDDPLHGIYLFRVGDCAKYLNVIGNFFVYTLTAASFRAFLRNRMLILLSLLCPGRCAYTSSLRESIRKSRLRRLPTEETCVNVEP